MNIFYAPPQQHHEGLTELRGQEARHAARALRYRQGDRITVVDGAGGWFEGTIQSISADLVRVVTDPAATQHQPRPRVSMALGIIKKRDRLEFAVEKAVELGVRQIILFRSEHTVKPNIRMDRLESIVVSAMKQSLHAWRPALHTAGSAVEAAERFGGSQNRILVAHETEQQLLDPGEVHRGSGGKETQEKGTADGPPAALLMVGPEGGFSEAEIEDLTSHGARLVSLGPSRLRAETAALTFLSQYLYSQRYWWSKRD